MWWIRSYYWPTDSNHMGGAGFWADCLLCFKEFVRRFCSNREGLRNVLGDDEINATVDGEVDKVMDELVFFSK
jgi:hypothetical protein